MLICWAVLGGFVLDAIFGDPAWLPHPVVLMGKAITALEKRLRTQFPQTPQGELCGGAVLAAILPVGTFLITAPEKILSILEVFGQESAVSHHINYGMLETDCCRQSFFRGAFLAGGSVTDPDKRYHLELLTSHPSVSREAFNLMLEMGFAPKDAVRSGGYITYFKQSEAIEDVLTTIGAPLAAMGIMQAKMQKDMRNAVNRRVNCDSANADKIVLAAQEQLDAIRELDRKYGLDTLPDILQETAMLRIANPESSLADLARLASPPVSKSCMSHRLKKLLEYKGD